MACHLKKAPSLKLHSGRRDYGSLASSTPSLPEIHKITDTVENNENEFLQRNKCNLIEELMKIPDEVLNEVESLNIITKREYRDLKSVTKPSQRINQLIDKISGKANDQIKQFVNVALNNLQRRFPQHAIPRYRQGEIVLGHTYENAQRLKHNLECAYNKTYYRRECHKCMECLQKVTVDLNVGVVLVDNQDITALSQAVTGCLAECKSITIIPSREERGSEMGNIFHTEFKNKGDTGPFLEPEADETRSGSWRQWIHLWKLITYLVFPYQREQRHEDEEGESLPLLQK
ncbi:unnamed protein product [Lampetra planeri]